MKLTFFGAARAVTGSCHCVECGGKKDRKSTRLNSSHQD